MARKSRETREQEIVSAIKALRDDCESQTSLIRNRWRENYDMFVSGSHNDNKEDWQTNFSVPKFETSIRTAQGRLVNILVNNPDWYDLEPTAAADAQRAELLRPAFKKMLDYYLGSAKFKRHAGTFMMCSLISSGNMHIGWKSRLIQNPKYILEATEKALRDEQRRRAKIVVNPQVESEVSADDFNAKLIEALEDFAQEAQGVKVKKAPTPQYVQVGCLDIKDINHEKVYWDPNCQYMEESAWRAFDFEVNLFEVKDMAKKGYISKSAIKRIGEQKDLYARHANERLRYKNTVASPKTKSNLVKLTFYAGPLIIDDEIVQDNYHALIANDTVILKDGEYPFWEPPGHRTSVITAAVRQVPFRPTGAGIGDNAVSLQKIYDSNWQLVCDTFRFGISGINVVNYQNLVDKSQLAEGIYPGMTLEVRGTPKESFEHINLTSNVENQAHPVQTMLEQAIDSATGINEMMTDGNNPYSRTAARETEARLQAGAQNVNIIALDLEQNFLVPALEKAFARVLQFGISEVQSNPELAHILTEEEKSELSGITAGDRLNILNQWYAFKIKGFSSTQDRDLRAQRDNELLTIINSGGPLSSLINLPEFMREYFKNRDIKEPEKLLLITNSPLQQVTNENAVLMSGHAIMPAENDDHEFHLKAHMPLAQSPFATPEMQQHSQFHLELFQQMQMAAQQQAETEGQPPIQ